MCEYANSVACCVMPEGQRTVREYRGEPPPGPAPEPGLAQPIPSAPLALVVLIRFVDGDAAKIFRHFQQALVAFVPIGTDFTQKHRSLICPAQLQESNLADMRAQPAG